MNLETAIAVLDGMKAVADYVNDPTFAVALDLMEDEVREGTVTLASHHIDGFVIRFEDGTYCTDESFDDLDASSELSTATSFRELAHALQEAAHFDKPRQILKFMEAVEEEGLLDMLKRGIVEKGRLAVKHEEAQQARRSASALQRVDEQLSRTRERATAQASAPNAPDAEPSDEMVDRINEAFAPRGPVTVLSSL